jgi:TonB family protein
MAISLKDAHGRIRWLRFLFLIIWIPLIAVAPPASGNAEVGLGRILNLGRGLSSDDIEQYAVKRVQPDYPMLAQKHKIEGIVIMELKVSGDGKVTDAQFVNGHNVFRSVSIEAAKQWEFKRGKGEEGIIRFTFKLR